MPRKGMNLLNLYFQYPTISFPKVLTFGKLIIMPLAKIVSEQDRAWGLWRIAEDEASLAERVAPWEIVSDTITNVNKRLEWLAGRVLVKEIFTSMSLNFEGITKDQYGKPFPRGNDYHLSLSHSFPYVAALVDRSGPVGIDLEQPKSKLLRIAHRILHEGELKDAGSDVIKHTVYWCAKETLVKLHGQKNLVFAENLIIDGFDLSTEGNIHGRIIVSHTERIIPLQYILFPNFVVVFNLRHSL
jgi:4'-phosphopantetheinyl transferase